jgi:hypothetical protein
MAVHGGPLVSQTYTTLMPPGSMSTGIPSFCQADLTCWFVLIRETSIFSALGIDRDSIDVHDIGLHSRSETPACKE